jgi:hypothetical protein
MRQKRLADMANRAGAKKCHEFETDLGDIAGRQAKNRRSIKINMSRVVRPYT